MKPFLIIFIAILFSKPVYAQKNNVNEYKKIKSVVTGFLFWYKKNINSIETIPILTGFNESDIKKGDSVVSLNENALDIYINNLKKADFLSPFYLNNLKNIYQTVGISLKKYPLIDYFGPIPDLEADIIFSFEPEETLDYIDKGVFSKIRVVGYHALVQFDIPNHEHRIFLLTKIDNKWLIDRIEFNHEYYEGLMK